MNPEPASDIRRARLGELLIRRGIITEQQLEEALTEQKGSGRYLGSILVSKGWASEEEVTRALSEQMGLAYVDIITHPVDPDTLQLIPREVCRAHQAVPLFILGDSITVAMANPMDLTAINALERVTQKRIRPVFSTPSAILRTLDEAAGKQIFQSPTSLWLEGGIVGLPVAEPTEVPTGTADPVAKLKAVASLAPVIQMVDNLIVDAVNAGASDIHLEPSEDQFRCRFRVDGILHNRPALAKEYQAAIVSRIKIMANMDIAEKRLPQDGRIQTVAAGRPVDLRISAFPTIQGEKVVIRILDKQRALLTLEELGFSESVFAQYSSLVARPHGIILVTGPTGSGKTTTLYATLNRINRSEKNVMTLEDPVEYELPLTCQAQVNIKAGLTFASGLRSMVRQDPDIILIGEIRDLETAEIAIHASLTGHLVLSTLHTNDAASAATRLVDMGVEPFLVASSLAGILAQRLVRVLCPSCKVPYTPSQELLGQLGVVPAPEAKFYQPAGCSRCRQTGYQGRVGIYELLMPTPKIREMIGEKALAGEIREEAFQNGMVSLKRDGIEKAMRGITSIAEILRVSGEE